MTSVFPLGKPEHNYTLEVRVKVMDAYLLSAETQFSVRVRIESLKFLTNVTFPFQFMQHTIIRL